MTPGAGTTLAAFSDGTVQRSDSSKDRERTSKIFVRTEPLRDGIVATFTERAK